jgi:hypothetical protein
MEQKTARILGFVLVLVGLLIVVHHVMICGRLFDVGDMIHHEFFEAIFFTAGIVFIFTSLTKDK